MPIDKMSLPTPAPALSLSSPAHPEAGTEVRDERLWAAAKGLEASFLSEMLKSAGVGEARSSFGGGAGEAQFSSFLRDIRARDMVETGGIGLAERLYSSLKGKIDDN